MGKFLDRAFFLLDQSRYDLAENELRQELAGDPNSSMAHALLALCLARREQFKEATEEAQQAIHLAPDLAYPHYALASVLSERRYFNDAEKAVKQAIELDPYQPDFFGLLSTIHLNERRWQDALDAAEAGLAIDPEHINCNNMRAMALVKLGRRDEAGATMARTLSRDPEDALSHANQGWTLLEQGDPKKAMEHFREALRLEPNLDWARQGIVEALKARNIIYRVMLWYFLWMAKLSRGAQWGIIIGGYVGYRILSGVARDNPNIAPFLWPILAAYFVFAILTWLAYPLFNLLLRLNRFGRLALSPDQITASNWIGLCLLVAILAFGLSFVPGYEIAMLVALVFGLSALPLSSVFICAKGWPRTAMALYTLVLGGVGLGSMGLLLARDPAWSTLLNLFFLGIFLSGFVANGLMTAMPRR